MNTGIVFEGNTLYMSSQIIVLVLDELGMKEGDFTLKVINPLKKDYPIALMQKLFDYKYDVMTWGTIPIVQYLYRNYAPPTGKKEETDVHTWIGMYEHTGHVPISKMLMSVHAMGHPIDDVVVRQQIISKALVVLNEALSTKAYIAGERFTIADAVYLPIFWHFIEKCNGARELLDQYQNVSAWYDRIVTRDSWVQIVQRLKLKTDVNLVYPQLVTPLKIDNSM